MRKKTKSNLIVPRVRLKQEMEDQPNSSEPPRRAGTPVIIVTKEMWKMLSTGEVIEKNNTN